MRDLLQGFDWFVEQEKELDIGLVRSAKAIESGQTPADRVERVQIKKFGERFHRVSARYSAGVELAALAPEVRWLLDRVNGRPVGSKLIWHLGSLGLLLGVVGGEAELRDLFPGVQDTRGRAQIPQCC